MSKQRPECNHHPIAQYSRISRFIKMLALRKTDKTYFCCSACGAFLRIPTVYTHTSFKITYLAISILISILTFGKILICGLDSATSRILSVCFICFLMHFLQIVASTAILTFSNWDQAASKKDAQIQFKLMKKQDTEIRLLWMFGISLSIGYLVGLPWYILLLLLMVVTCTVIARGCYKSFMSRQHKC